MAQTTTAVSGVNAIVEMSADGATWVNVSGSTNQVAGTEQARATSDHWGYDSDLPIVLPAKRETLDLTVRALYTETAAEAYPRVRALFEAVGGDSCWLRWIPSGQAGGRQYVCEQATVTRFGYPSVDGQSARPIAVEMGFRCGELVDWHGGVPASEYEELRALYDALGGAAWDDAPYWWDDTLPMVDWNPGRLAVTAGHLTTINLANNGVAGSLPSTWGSRVPYLHGLNFNVNNLTTPQVDSIIAAVYAQRLSWLDASPYLYLAGNEVPSGFVAAPAACPPATGGETLYELARDTCGSGHTQWSAYYGAWVFIS